MPVKKRALAAAGAGHDPKQCDEGLKISGECAKVTSD